ncbi:MAG: DNA polymerase I [Candidatus Aminicenantes bacterium]|nr:DNA polymerase I [Candidatus Aminicenantes bacterium]
MKPEKLFLIDGNSILYRSFFAIQRLSTSSGFPTNAIYGFLNTLRKIQEQEKPSHLGIVFDTGKPTLRHKTFEKYKAQRKPMPDDLQIQVPYLKKVIQALRIPLFEYENYEADDVLASLAKLAADQGILTIIVTTDKDLFQLVNDKTIIYNPAKDLYLDQEKVKEIFGVAPEQVVDVLSLWGDPSDNIPGVPGIGEKTSKTLIQQFGSLDNLLANLEKVQPPRIREAIRQNLDKINLSRQLIVVEKNLPLEFNLEAFAVSEPDQREVIRLFQELEFTSLLQDFIKKQEISKDYQAILNLNQLKNLITSIEKFGYFSLETEFDRSSPIKAKLIGLSFAFEPGKAFYLPLGHEYIGAPPQIPKEEALALLKPILTNPEIKKIGQNIKYDLIGLKKEGIDLKGIDLDTMILSYLLEPNWGKHNLERLALHYLQETSISYEEIVGKGKKAKSLKEIPIEIVTPYACQEADLALRLSQILWPKIKQAGLDHLYQEIEKPLIEVLAKMEIWGVKVDRDVLRRLARELEEELQRLERKIYEAAGVEFNINSSQQLADILFRKIQLTPGKKTKITKRFSTSIEVLQELASCHPLAQYVLEYRLLAKLKSTYADALPELINPETGRIHTSYNQTVTATGRLSSSEPNLQNIPARGELGQRFRQAFIPEEGHLLLAADYAQIELRILAHLSEDPTLIEIFLTDRDVHAETARHVFGEASLLFSEEMRRRAKIINFSLIYGTSAYSLAKELGTSTSEAQSFIDRYFSQHPKVAEFLEKTVAEATERGYTKTLFGRIRQVPELKQKDKLTQQAGKRIALNAPIQGSAADIMKKAMIDIYREIMARSLRTKMILQVHDELVFEVPEEEQSEVEALVREKMEKVYPLRVPLKVHLGWGRTWADAK